MLLSSLLDKDNQLYRLILDNALDAFIAIDEHSRIIEWSKQAEQIFGWSKQEAIGFTLTETIIPERFWTAHFQGLQKYIKTAQNNLIGNRVEIFASRKDGSEIPVELTITPIQYDNHQIFSASIRDISRNKQLEREIDRQANLTSSILDSMAGAVAVADLRGQLILINPAAQHLLHMRPVEEAPGQSFYQYHLLRPDGKTPFAKDERPTARALRGEAVTGMIAFIHHEGLPEGAWVSINARPLKDENGSIIGAVVVFHDVTQLRLRETALAQQAAQLKEQAELLDLAQDAILVRSSDDRITYWNRSAERLYGYTKEEAIGCVSHELFKTKFPVPLKQIKAALESHRYWEGNLTHYAKDGREIIVFSQWAIDMQDGRPTRYLETNADITQQVQTERAFRQTQENYRLLVETTTDFAIIMTDPGGVITSWNPGAQQILGMTTDEAIGQPIASLFTPEDRLSGRPMQELAMAKESGRAEDIRWHLRKDGSRIWVNGVVMPLWNEDGTVRGFVKVMRDQTSQRLEEEQTQFLALHDALTGLPNRVHFSNQLHKAIAQSERTDTPLSVLLLDLDRFKYVNDTFGHHVGDLLLKEVAARILSSMRETDMVARLGGDEFVVIQADTSQPTAAATLAQKLITELGRPYRLEGHEIISGTSVGISTFPTDAQNPVELLKRADLALYRAKSAGKGNYQFYTSALSAEKNSKRNREMALRQALENHEFTLYYQPQIDLNNWKISTVEALLRWQANELEMVLPHDFLSIAEETGLIVEIGQWALEQACRQVKAWQEQGMSGLRISVNCSARQFSEPEFVKRIRPILEKTGLSAACLELEITEPMLTRDPRIKEQLTELRSEGVRITIDNYGTGTTALIDLKEFEVDGLKIDKAFVQHLPHRRKDTAITSAIISLAHDLGIGVSAGGVETAEQLAYLKARDCNSAQGFIFTPPIPAEKLGELMFSGRWSHVNRVPAIDEKSVLKDLH